jgi:hypothetical protein
MCAISHYTRMRNALAPSLALVKGTTRLAPSWPLQLKGLANMATASLASDLARRQPCLACPLHRSIQCSLWSSLPRTNPRELCPILVCVARQSPIHRNSRTG